jgi:DNA-binding response OmpR family regulator
MLSKKDQYKCCNIALDLKRDIQRQKLIIATSSQRGSQPLEHLVSQMYDIVIVFTVEQVLHAIDGICVGLVFIDIATDDIDSISLLRILLSNGNKFLVLVRSETDDEIDRIVALELGADDCVHSSCGPRELRARVSALLRRYQKISSTTPNIPVANKADSGDELSHAGWILNRSRCQLSSPTGDVVYLTSSEFEILSVLFREPGVIKDRLSLRNIAGNNEEYDLRTLDVFISRLRKKLSQHGGRDLIKTIRGRGYRLSESTSSPNHVFTS